MNELWRKAHKKPEAYLQGERLQEPTGSHCRFITLHIFNLQDKSSRNRGIWHKHILGVYVLPVK